jgi:hypothetical protein
MRESAEIELRLQSEAEQTSAIAALVDWVELRSDDMFYHPASPGDQPAP